MPKLRETKLPYGHDERVVRIRQDRVAWVLSPKDTAAVPDVAATVRAALRSPIGSPRLSELVRMHGKHVVVLADDNTRMTPQRLLLPPLLDELNAAGVADDQITVLIALGTHRKMTHAECRAHFGDAVVDRVWVENLDNDNPKAFVDVGETATGIPVQVARRYVDAQIKIAVGNIIPHMYAGWSGGAKTVQPGVCSHLTTCRTHVMAGPRVYEILGDLDNPVRQEIDDIGLRTGLTFIVNTVLNRRHEVVRVVAGHPIAAHREGVKTSRKVYGVDVPSQVDVVVASSSPADRDLWQGFKPLNAAGMTVRAGGEVILLIPAPEGLAPDHASIMDFGVMPNAEVLARVARGEIADEVAAATYMAMNVTRSRARITLVTDGIKSEDAARLSLGLERDLDAAIKAAVERAGASARVGIITHAADLLPVVQRG
jgi:nickel-dependent lactate racemase